MLYMILYLFYELLFFVFQIIFRKHDGCLDNLSAYIVGNTGDGTFHYSGVGHERTFHLKRADAVAR